MNALADQPRINRVVLRDAQHAEKQQHQKRIEWTGVQRGENRRHDRDEQRSNERNEFKNSGDHPHHQSTRQTEQSETERANDADEQTRGELRAYVSGERAVDVLEEFVAAPAPAASRQHQQRRTAKTLRVLEQEKRKNRNQNQPGNI